MVEFFIMIVIIGVCYLIFGKADSKNDVLQTVGLKLDDQKYESKKTSEFSKYCLQAMKKAVDREEYKARTEEQFLNILSDILYTAGHGRYVDDGFGDYTRTSIYLGVKPHYINHAETVVYRRKKDISNGKSQLLCKSCDFSDKRQAKKYCELLWDKYQYPWPDKWLKKDSGL